MKHTVSMFAVFVGVALVGCALAGEGGDILINDFEGSGWGDWKTEGQAFGAGPWHGCGDNPCVLFSPTAWGHAVSTDLLHWRQLPDAIRCEEEFDWSGYSCAGVASVEGKPSGFIMSGSSVVDIDNDSGLKKGDHPPILGFYTYPGDKVRGQCMAFSTDGGMTFTKYQANPVLPGPGVADRDPKVFQHGGKWYMALSHAWGPGHSGNLSIHLYESANLTRWSHLGEIPSSVNFCECPDIFSTYVDGNENNVKWILIAGDLLDIAIDFEPGDAQRIELTVRGTPIVYNVAEKQLLCLASTMSLGPINGHVKLRLLVDRISVEVFGNDGQATMSNYFMPPKDNTSLALAAIGGRCRLVLAEVHELRSAITK